MRGSYIFFLARPYKMACEFALYLREHGFEWQPGPKLGDWVQQICIKRKREDTRDRKLLKEHLYATKPRLVTAYIDLHCVPLYVCIVCSIIRYLPTYCIPLCISVMCLHIVFHYIVYSLLYFVIIH